MYATSVSSGSGVTASFPEYIPTNTQVLTQSQVQALVQSYSGSSSPSYAVSLKEYYDSFLGRYLCCAANVSSYARGSGSTPWGLYQSKEYFYNGGTSGGVAAGLVTSYTGDFEYSAETGIDVNIGTERVTYILATIVPQDQASSLGLPAGVYAVAVAGISFCSQSECF